MPDDKILAEPFASIFTNWDDAMWGLDFLLQTFQRMGVKDAGDKRFAITLRNNRILRLNFGHWLLFDFHGKDGGTRTSITMAIFSDVAKKYPYQSGEPFKQRKETQAVTLMWSVPLEDFKDNKDNIQSSFFETCDYVFNHFKNWKAAPYRKFNVGELADAVFDPNKRHRLLSTGPGEEIPPNPPDRDDARKPVAYPLNQCAEETGISVDVIKRWLRAMERKKQAVFYGPPGTGKTYIAQKIAQLLTDGSDEYVDIVQFHPAYSYEDFIQGIRPQSLDGKLSYPMMDGRFVEFCKSAENTENICVLIIDEINRANLSRVFGELMYALEYRDQSVKLASGDNFRIPDNVRIIGTMNTADRSIALVDHALRRRFAFLELKPDMDILRRYHEQQKQNVDGLIKTIEEVNRAINDPHYEIGISFFMQDNLPEHIEDIWRMEIAPYLEEYFFDQSDKVAQKFSWEKVKDQIGL